MNLPRRNFLQMAAATCACCAPLVRAVASEPSAKGHATPHWGYSGSAGPEHWGSLRPDFKVCQLGLEQTPIDLKTSIKGDVGNVEINFKPIPLRILNNGHTIQVNADPGCSSTIAGTRYDMLQFHFHHPSEHLLSGKAFQMECHFVHKSAEGGLAVIGVFIQPGARNKQLASVFDSMPAKEGPEIRASGVVDPAELLPRDRSFFRYMGSLTTPPCSEGLTWTVFKEPIEAAPEQIRQFAMLFANNARPVQRPNRRLVVETN